VSEARKQANMDQFVVAAALRNRHFVMAGAALAALGFVAGSVFARSK